MKRFLAPLFLFCVGHVLAPLPASAITIDTMPVGNPGNAGELSGAGAGGYGPDAILGAVAYAYNIGTTEVTNAQYAAFLNEKAKSDPLALYNTGMGSDARGGITQSGLSPNFTYAPKTNMGNKPVNFVSWYDAIRFANWLNNGQGAGDTETGAYTILGGTRTPTNGNSITRITGATWFLPSENEWYKAAYHQPAAQGGDVDNYWLYPTKTNSEPTIATANSVGEISNPGANVANYGADFNSQDGKVTTVGSAGPLSDSFYGTADQGGNVWEWNEALFSNSTRGVRGGAFNYSTINLRSSIRSDGGVAFGEAVWLGFRVATVPEPSTAVLAALGILALIGLRKCRRSIGSAIVFLALAVFAADARAVTIQWSLVGNPGNADDPADGDRFTDGIQNFGAVPYAYNIGTKDVTANQYVEFLNAKDAGGTNTLFLYNTNMSNATFGGISFTAGNPNGSKYGVISGREDHPANFTTWYDSIRFANWLNNGQGSGDTETGAYTLGTLGGGGVPVTPPLTHNAGSQVWLPTENEWYKAAYYAPGSSSYNLYATSSNTIPVASSPTALANHANFNRVVGNLTDVGAYTGTTSPYGAFDMGGNVFQWNEALISGSFRGLRGGSFDDGTAGVRSSFRIIGNPSVEGNSIGFRVASVPEPSSAVLAGVACGLMRLLRKRFKFRSARVEKPSVVGQGSP